MAGAQQTDPRIAAVFQKYGAIVYRRALLLLGSPSDAEDATQDVFVQVLNKIDGFEGRSEISTWLYRVTTNHCLNVLRNQRRRQNLLKKNMPSKQQLHPGLDPDDLVTMRQLLHTADPQQAMAAVFVYVDGMSRQEAAETLEVSLRTVGNLLSRFQMWARERLAQSQ